MADYRTRTRDRERYRDDNRNHSDRDRTSAFDWDDRRNDHDHDRGSRNYREQAQSRAHDRFGNDDADRRVPINETSRLIASNKVEGTPVYGRDGDRLGSIYNVMLDKRSGHVEYAVMTSGGFLGMGAEYKPVPWQMLRYDDREDGYRINMTQHDLDRAPGFRRGEEPRFDRDYDIHVYRWYGL